jgi:hypothetical protein
VEVEMVPCMSDESDEDDALGKSAGVEGREGPVRVVGRVLSRACTTSKGSIEIPRVIGSVWGGPAAVLPPELVLTLLVNIGIEESFGLVLVLVLLVLLLVRGKFVSSVISSMSSVPAVVVGRFLMRKMAEGLSFARAPRSRKGRAGLSWM